MNKNKITFSEQCAELKSKNKNPRYQSPTSHCKPLRPKYKTIDQAQSQNYPNVRNKHIIIDKT